MVLVVAYKYKDTDPMYTEEKYWQVVIMVWFLHDYYPIVTSKF